MFEDNKKLTFSLKEVLCSSSEVLQFYCNGDKTHLDQRWRVMPQITAC